MVGVMGERRGSGSRGGAEVGGVAGRVRGGDGPYGGGGMLGVGGEWVWLWRAIAWIELRHFGVALAEGG